MSSIARHQLRLLPVLAIVVLWGCFATPTAASVAMLTNRTKQKADFTLIWSAEKRSQHSLEAGALVPVAINNGIRISYKSGERSITTPLQPNTIHYFVSVKDKLSLVKIKFPASPGGTTAPLATMEGVELAPVAKIPVMLLVDDDEPTVQRLWEARLRKRLDEASDIFEKHCRVRFEVVAVGMWSSDNTIVDFKNSLREFELEVNPAPGRLAIGFTSQYRIPKNRTMHLGGTRGPLYPYVLIREWAQHVTKTERLEILVHELGHYLGCVHNPEKTSVMRPSLGDHRSHSLDFRIQFDPANAMAMYLLGEEMRRQPVKWLCHLNRPAKANLHSLYLGLAKTMKGDDKSAEQYIQMLTYALGTPADVPKLNQRLIEATRTVVQAVAEAASQNHGLPPKPSADGNKSPEFYRLSGDQLTNFYVRKAAAAAAELPKAVARKAFLVGVGIVLDRSSTVRYSPTAREICGEVESNTEWRARLKTMGQPTMRGDRAMAQRFAAACAITGLTTPVGAEAFGVNIEIRDSQRGQGFSFNRLTADTSGMAFCAYVTKVDDSLTRLAHSFTVEAFMPQPELPEEKLTWADFIEQYGSAHDARFQAKKTAIRRKVIAMPAFQPR